MAYKGFESDLRDFFNLYPQFHEGTSNGVPFTLEGRIDIENTEGYILDSFDVRIEMPKCYPKCFPRVWETSNRIPRHIDWHLFPTDDFRFCFASRIDEIIISKHGITLVWFMTKILEPYLAGQAFKLRNPDSEYPQGERPHGKDGDFETLKERLQTKDKTIVLRSLQLAAGKHCIGRNSLCYCGAQAKYKKCHMNAISDLMALDKAYLDELIMNFSI